MSNKPRFAAVVAALTAVITASGCAAADVAVKNETADDEILEEVRPGEIPEIPELPDIPDIEEGGETPPEAIVPPEEVIPQKVTRKYLTVNGDGVNLRSGAGTGYTALGTAQKSTKYAFLGESGGWYKTYYKNRTAYISAKYCKISEMETSEEKIEAVIEEGTKLLGTKYVYGAVRYHDGAGNRLKNFDVSKFDCSSLMQYIFYKGAQYNLKLNTRTQVTQGKTVSRSQLKRGDLMFFTNDQRKYNTGVERIGHVALYLGENLILHTASDFAKIEEISSKRWGYFIQGQRVL